MMTAPAATEETSLKAPLAWSAVVVVLAGYLWALLVEHSLALLGLAAFLAVTVALFFALRKPGAAAKVAPLVLLVVVLAAIVAGSFLL